VSSEAQMPGDYRDSYLDSYKSRATSGTACLERLLMIYGDYLKKNIGFCLHTLWTHICVQTPYKSDFCINVSWRRAAGRESLRCFYNHYDMVFNLHNTDCKTCVLGMGIVYFVFWYLGYGHWDTLWAISDWPLGFFCNRPGNPEIQHHDLLNPISNVPWSDLMFGSDDQILTLFRFQAFFWSFLWFWFLWFWSSLDSYFCFSGRSVSLQV